jgi:signal transduction histidine kinase
MSFRWRLFLCLALAVLAGTTVEAVTDYLESRASLRGQIDESLEQVREFTDTALSFENGEPRVDGTLEVPFDSRVRVLREDNVLLELDRSEREAELALREQDLPDGLRLELAVDTRTYRELLNTSFRRDLTDDVIQVLLSTFVAFILSSIFLRPLKTLHKAMKDMAQHRFPEPIAVPRGNDVLAQLANTFNNMSANIQAAIDRERVFTRYVSHELRTPLSAMKLQLESLEMGLSPVEKVVPTVQRNLERMQRVLEALLSLARAKEKNHEPVPLVYLVKESLQLLPKESQARVVIKSSISPNLKVPQPYLMGQCVLNLIDNAIKYSKGQVKVTLEPFAGRVQVRVEDEGEGVPEEVLDKLTHTFFRLSSTVEGSGLGLAFVKHIVRTFEGELELRNTGTGLEVVLTLPVAP